MIYTTAADTYAVTDLTAAGRAILDDADAAAQRTTLGLGSIATQAANNVSITGGSITGITDLAVSDGGTGASSFTANNVLLGNNTSAFQVVAPGTSGNVLTSNGTTWTSATPAAGYTDADVDTHLNTGTAASGEVLSWTGSDYDWITAGGAFSVIGTNNLAAIATLPALTTGTNNFVAGFTAGNSLTSGSHHVAIGEEALFSTTTNSASVAIGRSAGRNGNQRDAVSIGDNAGLSGAFRGVAVGYFAGHFNTGSYRIAIGDTALNGLSGSSTGADNIGIGRKTGFDLTTGAANVLVGPLSGENLTTGSNNVALGNGALDAATTGGRNIAIGQDAMGLGVATDATGDNIAIGYQAGYDLTTGTDNVVVGEIAGTNLTTGSNNVAIGNGALDAATTGGENIAIGLNAMGLGVATATSGDNIAIGKQAGEDITSGFGNVLVGRTAGWDISTGTNNTLVGRNAGNTLTTGTNNLVLGSNSQPSSATVSNEITLGNSSITNFRVPGVGFQFDTTDGLIVPKTITAGGTTGAQTINKTAGSVNFAAAATSLVVTNSFVDANSVIIATVATDDTTMKSVAAVAGAGSFTLYANAATTAETRVNWFVAN